ncbi:MarR family transcriptional regulator [Natronorubrum daqingense]|uniref:ArsR family transcriptional regulator n=1 Tax=Natronorubrum daqingense TaxID=588898 RepID=A0A1N6Y442_9EURY|nr:helix-turn-helix domain-containing protein [Natronorubrum daqingense]APX95786.1 ArsR family transcriptional regulator [Natronorubrum daqingense]SIR09314.1 Winged helix-turn-helix DNA-binding [Natronorubrum daqingense]
MSASEAFRQDAESRGSWDDVRDLPPSAKLVAKVLEYNETMTQQQIADETLLPSRTVRYALNRLEDEHVIDSRFSFSDARKRLYSLDIEA